MLSEKSKINLFNIINNRSNIVIIDTFNYLFKYAYVYGTDTDKYIHSTASLSKRIKKIMHNSSIIYAIDGESKIRKEINHKYKANRNKPPFTKSESIIELVNKLKNINNVYVSQDEKYEADDTIYSIIEIIKYLCNKHKIKKKVYILSTDKDMYQMIGKFNYVNVKVIKKISTPDSYDNINKTWKDDSNIINTEKAMKSFNNVKPCNLVKYRALVGDESDNLNGYYRINRKSASDIAENCIYDKDTERLILEENKNLSNTKTYDILNMINNNFNLFRDNYRIMSLYFFYPEVLKPEEFSL